MRAVDSKDSWPAGFMGHGLESSTREEIGNLNLWFPISCGPRGSQALPTRSAGHQSAGNPADSQTSAALIYGGRGSSGETPCEESALFFRTRRIWRL